MAGSIPTAYTTGFNNKYPVFFVVRINISGGDTLNVLSQPGVDVSYNGIGLSPDYDYVEGSASGAYLAVEIDGAETEGIGEIDSQMNVQDGGGIGAVGECNVVFLNQARFDDFISQFDIENRTIEIWEGYDPPSHIVAIDTDMLLKFRGIIRDASSWDYTRFTIPCVDRRSLDSILLPNNKIQKDVFPNAPDPSIGKVVPILVGDFASENFDAAFHAGRFNCPPTIVVDDKNLYYMVADHPVTFTPDNHLIIDKPDDWIAKINNGRAVLSDDTFLKKGGTKLQVIQSGLSDVFVIPKNPAAGNTVADISAAVDKDDDSYIQMVAPDVASFGFGNIPSPGNVVTQDDADAIITDVAAYVVGIEYSDCFGNVPVQVLDRRNGAAQDIGNLDPDPFVTSVALVVNVPGLKWEDLMNQFVKIICLGTQHVKIRHVYVWVKARAGSAQWQQITTRRASVDLLGNYYRPEEKTSIYVVQNVRSNVFPSVTGVKYGSWIERSTNGYLAGGLIEQPAYFIEYLLRERLNLSDAQIDVSSFDDVGVGTRGAYLMAASMLEEREAFEHIRQICEEFMLQLVVTNQGKYRLVSLDAVDAGTSTVFTADSSTIMYEGTPQISITKTPISKIKNTFTLNYRMNYATNQMERSVFFRADGTNNIQLAINLFGDAPRSTWGSWLGESQTRYNQKIDYVADLHYVRDDTTAGLILTNLAAWLAFKRMVVETKLKRNLQTVALEIGDHIRVTNDLLGNIASGTVNFIITKINYPGVGKTMAPYITVSCEELPNQYTGMTQIKKLSDEMWSRS